MIILLAWDFGILHILRIRSKNYAFLDKVADTLQGIFPILEMLPKTAFQCIYGS